MSTICVNGHFLHQRLTGVQRYAIEILKGFDRAGYDYRIEQPPDFMSSGKLLQHAWEQAILPGRAGRHNILWSPTNTGPVFASNHIITLHDIGVFPHPEWFSKAYVRWKRTLIPSIVRRAQGILTVSEFSRQIICRYLPVSAQKVKVVYNGVDTNQFRPSPKSRIAEIRHKYSISSPYFLVLGSMDPRKNFGRLLEAWKKCVEEENLTGYKLVIAGGSNANFRQFKVDESAQKVRFIGYVPDDELPPLYSGATGFFFPSLFEGFGLPVVEAMACGTPVLTSSTTALDEIAGDAALKVAPGQVSSIKEGILNMANSPSLRKTLSDRGMERVSLFNWDQSAAMIYDYLKTHLPS